MGKIIWYDFRFAYRQEQIEEIRKRTIEREALLKSPLIHNVNLEELARETKRDAELLTLLQDEENRWKEVGYKWVEQY